MKKVNYSYNKITQLIKDNAHKINNYNPDYIIAIGGGGLIPARLIRNYVKKPLYVVTLSLYDDDKIKDTVEIIQWIDNDLSEKKIMIVDEVDDTRKTLDFCIKRFKLINNAKDIGVFVLQNKIKEKLGQLDDDIKYISCENVQDDWIVYPWDL